MVHKFDKSFALKSLSSRMQADDQVTTLVVACCYTVTVTEEVCLITGNFITSIDYPDNHPRHHLLGYHHPIVCL
jgi:hypothetical protein